MVPPQPVYSSSAITWQGWQLTVLQPLLLPQLDWDMVRFPGYRNMLLLFSYAGNFIKDLFLSMIHYHMVTVILWVLMSAILNSFLPLLQCLDLPLTFLPQVPQGHLPCQAHHCLGRQLLDHQCPSLIMYSHHHLHRLCQGHSLGLPWVASMDPLLQLILLSQDTKCSRTVSIPTLEIVHYTCCLCTANWELDFSFVTCGLLVTLQCFPMLMSKRQIQDKQ